MMMDNPDIFLNTCRYCMGSGELGLGFYQPCFACDSTGAASPPDEAEAEELLRDRIGEPQ